MDVYILDLDPGQPNFNLAGQLTLLRANQMILTNNDFNDIEIVKGFYLNTPSPSLNETYYYECVSLLYQEYQKIMTDKQKILIVNTCGWVEG